MGLIAPPMTEPHPLQDAALPSWNGARRTRPPQSFARVAIDTAGLSPEATELANRLARDISRLTPEDLGALKAELIKRAK